MVRLFHKYRGYKPRSTFVAQEWDFVLNLVQNWSEVRWEVKVWDLRIYPFSKSQVRDLPVLTFDTIDDFHRNLRDSKIIQGAHKLSWL